MMFLPGRLLFHSSLPVFLSSAMKLGALGLGMLMWPSSTPLAVTMKIMSPTISGQQAAMLCGNTFSSLIMSYSQMMSASVASLYFSVWMPWLPSARPFTSTQTTVQRLLT